MRIRLDRVIEVSLPNMTAEEVATSTVEVRRPALLDRPAVLCQAGYAYLVEYGGRGGGHLQR